MRKLFFLLSLATFFWSCDFRPGEKAKLISQMDSLKVQLADQRQMAGALDELATLMDSIDVNRDMLRTSMLEGTTYDAYVTRMRDINDYVKATHSKIEELEKALKHSKSSSASIARSLRLLKADLKTKGDQLVALQTEVDKYRNENSNLLQTVDLQRAELDNKAADIVQKKLVVDSLDAQIKSMIVQAKVDEGESYFLRAQALETAADRTHFAPRKKKATRLEALELYRLAAFYGKTEAEQKVKELEKVAG